MSYCYIYPFFFSPPFQGNIYGRITLKGKGTMVLITCSTTKARMPIHLSNDAGPFQCPGKRWHHNKKLSHYFSCNDGYQNPWWLPFYTSASSNHRIINSLIDKLIKNYSYLPNMVGRIGLSTTLVGWFWATGIVPTSNIQDWISSCVGWLEL